jgi:hypothetical protein
MGLHFCLCIPTRRETASRTPTVRVQLPPQAPREIGETVSRLAYTQQSSGQHVHLPPFPLVCHQRANRFRSGWTGCNAQRGDQISRPRSPKQRPQASAWHQCRHEPDRENHRSVGHERAARLKPVCMRLQPPPLRPLSTDCKADQRAAAVC